jgi:4-amino-4-deoxy-L-arabinose transferase-like glycosyltransferase
MADRHDPANIGTSGMPLASRLGLQRWHLAAALAAGSLVYLYAFFSTAGPRQQAYLILTKLYLPLPEEFLCRFVGSYEKVAWSQFGLLDRLPLFAAAASLLLSATSAGWLVLPRRLRLRLSGLEQTVFAAGLGLHLQSLYTLAVGLAGGLHNSWLMIAPMLIVVILAAARLYRTQPVSEVLMSGWRNIRDWPRRYVFWLLLPVFVMLLLMAAIPPWEFDVREYHLQVPKEWYQQGWIGFLPHNVYGNMPLGGEMHALSAMMLFSGKLGWWYGALAGKIVMASLSWIAATGLYCLGRRFHSPQAGLIAATVYLSTPWVVHVSSLGLVEGILGAYLLLSFYAVVLWWQPMQADESPESAATLSPESAATLSPESAATLSPESAATLSPESAAKSPPECAATLSPESAAERGELGFVGLAGVLAGAAVSTKYTGLVLVAAPLAAWIGLAARPPRWRPWLLFCLLALASGGLWYAKNAVLAGNPTYPLLYGLWGGRDWDEVTDARWRKAHGPQPDGQGRRFTWPQWRAAGRDVIWASDKLSPLLWPLAAFAGLARRRRVVAALALLLVVNFCLWWLLTHRYDRFFVPMFPLLAMLAGLGACWTDRRAWQLAMGWLISVVVVLNLLVVATGVLTGDNRICMQLDLLRTDAPQDVLLERVHPTHLYLNAHVPPGTSALLVAEAQAFDLEVPVYYSTCWNACALEQWLKGKSREERLRVLAQQQVSYVLIRWDEIARYQSPGNYGFPAEISREWVHDELVTQQRILRPVPVVIDGVEYLPTHGEVFEVLYENAHAPAVDRR